MLDHAESLPVPQREALRIAFGLSAGPAPDRFLVGLAVVGLLSETAVERPLVCVVDDQQWLDHASAQALGFAARRLAAEPVGLVFAARVPGKDLAGLPELVVEGLADDDARELLKSVLAGPLDAQVRDQIIADTNGNPLALLELPRGLTPAQLAGGFGLSSAVPLDGRIEESFARQLKTLPAQTRRLRGGRPACSRSAPGARAELRTSYDLFTTMGIEAFAERARRELLATGDTVRKRTVETASELTAQEACIARLAVNGRTNVEIGAQLFLSTRTVEWHLDKVYNKLGVGSRRELRQALASPGHADR